MASHQKHMRSAQRSDGMQRAEFEKLTEPQRRNVAAILCKIPLRDIDEVPATREALDEEVRLHQWEPPTDEAVSAAIEKALKGSAPAEPKAKKRKQAESGRREEQPEKKAKQDEEPTPKKEKPRATEPDSQPDDDWKEGFAAVPYPVIDKLLRAMHSGMIRVYVALLRHVGYTSGKAYPGQQRIAKLAGLADRQTRKYLHALRDAGLITIKRQGYFKGRENMPNLYEHVPVTRENWREILTKLEAWSLPRMSKADRKRLGSTDRNR